MSEKTTVQVLREARALISDPERWSKGWFAKDSGRHHVSPCDPRAVRWCALGAVRHASQEKGWMGAKRLLDRAVPSHIVSVNDAKGNRAEVHAQVLAAFDRAIELAEAES